MLVTHRHGNGNGVGGCSMRSRRLGYEVRGRNLGEGGHTYLENTSLRVLTGEVPLIVTVAYSYTIEWRGQWPSGEIMPHLKGQ